ncbi:hypothetical protein RIR_jg31772.t1 [Rhizophagus irregularis DAOM 181602=DAOM 197198]|nr:hypothetical protein RIR_jg31772.t1 [Rhizophagus irregularis DAOM 181602=DAOM 197198]
MFDAKFELKDRKRRYNCCIWLNNGKDLGKGLQMKGQDEIIGKDGNFTKRRKRMKEISNNEKATSSRTCNKDNVDSEDDNLNENKKRIMKSQCVREHADDE